MTPPPPDNITLTENEPMARHTSWRIGGPARYYAEVSGADQARALAAWAAAAGLPLVWVGGGTNLLVDDAGFPGVIARYRAQSWRIDEDGAAGLLWVEAGAPMAGTARRACQMGWAGLEWAEGVPGTIGGAAFGNAGCYGGDIAGILQSATLLVGAAVEEWPAPRMGYGYRTSALKGQGDRGTGGQGDSDPQRSRPVSPSERSERVPVSPSERSECVPVSASAASGPAPAPPLILAATLRLTRADPQALMAKIAGIAAERKRKTPVGSSCGSVFKNPPGQSAGQLIERAGLKGRRIGGAEISERHANYIVNVEGASGADILALVGLARAEVYRQFGVELELEVRVLSNRC